MKNTNKIIGLLILSFLSSILFAQTEQGVIRLGGNFAFMHQTEDTYGLNYGRDNDKHSDLMIQLEPGLFTGDQFLLGLDFGMYSGFSNGRSVEQEFYFGPQLSYYIKSGIEKVYFPIAIQVGYLIRKEAFGDSQATGLYYGGALGIEFIPKEALGIRISLNPRIRLYNYQMPSTEDRITNWNIQLGVAYYFKKELKKNDGNPDVRTPKEKATAD
jgi:hypothetical protein